jgi:predicted GTPase
VCPGGESCTKETNIGFGKWLGQGQNFTVVDTPGFGDTDNEPMAVKIMSVTSMGFVIASLDMLEPNAILVNQDSMTQMEAIRMIPWPIALNASVTLMVP